MSRRRGRYTRSKDKMPPSKFQQLSRKLRSSKKIQSRKKCFTFKAKKQKRTSKNLNVTKPSKIKLEPIEASDAEVPIKEEPLLTEVVESEQFEITEVKAEISCNSVQSLQNDGTLTIDESAETGDIGMESKQNESNITEEKTDTIDLNNVDKEEEIAEESFHSDNSMPLEKFPEDKELTAQNICSVCNVKTDSSATLTQHMKQHCITNNQTHQCLICSKSLSSASSLDRHMLVHSGERPFKCKLCDMSFTTNGNMHRHMRTHSEFEMSDIAKSLDLRKRDEMQNSENDSKFSDEKLYCPVCGKTFLCKYGLQSHMETHPNDPIICQKCNTISVNYAAHIEHTCSFPTSESPISCYKSCGFQDLTFMDFTTEKFSLVSKSYCEKNIRRPSSAFHIFQCPECSKAFPCSRALKLHLKIHETKIGTFCPSCQCDFAASSYLQVHQLKHRSVEHCLHEGFHTKTHIAENQIVHSGKEDFLALLNLQTKESQLSLLKSMNTCSVKEEEFENMDYFVHGKIIKKDQNCDSDGNNNSSNNNNNNNNDFADIQSIISLTSKAPLISAAQTSPVAARPASPLPYLTTQQPKSPEIAESANASPETPSKEELAPKSTNHDVPDVESPDVPGTYSCNVCTQQFKNSGALKRHCKLHVQRGSNYSCHLCSYVSVDKSTLIRHLRTHNGERPFQCVICKYAFTTKANCERHVRKRHKKFGKAEIRNAMQYNPNMSLRGSDPSSSDIGNNETVCKYCGVDFKFNRVLRHHLRSLHNSCNRKPFSCKICKFGFSTKNNCIRHVLKQHPNLKDKLRSVVIPNSIMLQINNTEKNAETDESNSSVNQPNQVDQAQPLDLHREISEKPLDLQTEKSSHEFANEAVMAAEGLVSLSEAIPLQDEPLDLAAHPLDLTCKPLAAITKKVDSKPSSIYNATSVPYKPTTSVNLSIIKTSILPESRLQVEPLKLTNSTRSENYNRIEVPSFPSSGQKLRSFTCIYCKAGFTLKSNMERHIKRKHPEFARPTRSRNYIPSIVSPNLQKQNPTTLSDKTRDALRHVLNNKVHQVPVYKAFNPETLPKLSTFKIVGTANNFVAQPSTINLGSTVNLSLDLSGKAKTVTIVDLHPKTVKLTEQNEENCSDLASVSSVICTANSPQFKQYLEKPTELEKVNITKKENNKIDETSNKKTEVPSVACPFCDRKFPWTSSLRRHILTHTGQKPFKCPKCSLWFTTKSNCERHLVRKHGHKGDLITRSVPDRPYKCNQCLTSTFSTQGNLRKHFYLKHWTKSYLGMNCKPIQSDKNETQTENKLEISISPATSQEHSYSQIERKNPFSCNFCNDSFESANERSSHMSKHNNIVYMCYMCKKKFPSHEICFSHFKTSHSLVYMQIIQNENACFNSKEYEDIVEMDSSESNTHPIACMVCFQKVSSVENLQQHFKKHLKDKNSDDEECSSPKNENLNNNVPVISELSEPNTTGSMKKIRTSKSKVKNSLLYFFTPSSSCNSSVKSIKNVNAKLDLTSQEEDSDLIQNLLGIHDSKMIDEMLVSADSAARLLGVKEV